MQTFPQSSIGIIAFISTQTNILNKSFLFSLDLQPMSLIFNFIIQITHHVILVFYFQNKKKNFQVQTMLRSVTSTVNATNWEATSWKKTDGSQESHYFPVENA